MNKNWPLLLIACFAMAVASAQTLFTYGDYSADAKDFLRAFNKNNTATAASKTKAMRDYLDLYITSRLKIREAYDRHYDTLPQIRTDIENLRSQIIENYLNDPELSDKLLKEAFQRSQKDIRTGHIFISFINKVGITDTAAAGKIINEVYAKLKKGEDFSKLAQQYSSDTGAKTNKGDIGFITVFTLPYEFENILYTTAPGKFSAPYKSKIGYHIFKNLGERKAIGKIKAAQVLIAFPPGANETVKKKTARLADSLYQRLMKGDDFAKLASQYSNDYISAASKGLIPDFGVGQYDREFEKVAFSLKNGQISKPFLTSHGYHIVKRIGSVPVISDPKNKSNMEDLKAKLNASDRMQAAKNAVIERSLKQIPIKKYPYSDKELMVLSDSILDNKPLTSPVTITKQTKLFSIGDETYTADDYMTYAQTWRYRADGTGAKPYQQVMDEFMHHQAEQYYRSHLEDFNADFRRQMEEFKDGNLFFEIMQREIWGKAQNDTAALETYYAQNKTRYNWKKSADAIVFFCSDEGSEKALYDQVKKNPSVWKTASDALAEKVVADSSRYELEQIPNNGGTTGMQSGMITSPVKNKTDGSVSFAYILKTYPTNMPRNYSEAKGLVINDYQVELEKQWVAELKKKYPVKIDEKVFQQIAK
jgi:peptidyl-prolyl cis-trans isomerase SurA